MLPYVQDPPTTSTRHPPPSLSALKQLLDCCFSCSILTTFCPASVSRISLLEEFEWELCLTWGRTHLRFTALVALLLYQHPLDSNDVGVDTACSLAPSHTTLIHHQTFLVSVCTAIYLTSSHSLRERGRRRSLRLLTNIRVYNYKHGTTTHY